MIRHENWKLNYYHGYQPELFDLQEDPDEVNDLSADSSTKGIKSELLDRLLYGWNPEWIQSQMRTLKEEQTIMENWAHNVDPADELRWNLDPNFDQLEN